MSLAIDPDDELDPTSGQLPPSPPADDYRSPALPAPGASTSSSTPRAESHSDSDSSGETPHANGFSASSFLWGGAASAPSRSREPEPGANSGSGSAAASASASQNVQFDHNTRSSPSKARAQLGPDGAGGGHGYRSGSTSAASAHARNLSISSAAGARTASSSVRGRRPLEGSSGTASPLIRARDRRTRVNTIPSWARDDPPSPRLSPSQAGGTLGRSSVQRRASGLPSHPSTSDISSIAAQTGSQARTRPGAPTQGQGDAASDATLTGGGAATWPRSSEPPMSAGLDADEEVDDSDEPGRWWTFTLPQKYRSRLHEHHMRMAAALHQHPSGHGQDHDHRPRQRDEEAGRDSSISIDNEQDGDRSAGVGSNGAGGNGNWMSWAQQRKDRTRAADDGEAGKEPSSGRMVEEGRDMNGGTPATDMRARIPDPSTTFTRHQPMTPGWDSPWRPGSRSLDGGFGGFHMDANGERFFPRVDTHGEKGKKAPVRLEWWRNFLLHNPFVPLLFRFINLAFTTVTLAIAIRIHLLLKAQNATDAVGSSPVLAIVFAPLTLVHVAVQIYMEYFGRPIGLWGVRSKLFYTLIELVFVCFWSAELSLAFDNYFTSPLICSTFNSPFAGPRQVCVPDPNTEPGTTASPLEDATRKPLICRNQGALIGLVFVSLMAYLIVLTVSLFRIFVRVSRRN